MKLLLAIALLLPLGCSTLSDEIVYQKRQGMEPEGFSDNKLSDTEYSIKYQSYKSDNWNEIQKNLLLRAAEIGKENNFKYFSITKLKKTTHKDKNTQTNNAIDKHTIGFGSNGLPIYSTNNIPYQFTIEFTVRTLSSVIAYSNIEGQYKHKVDEIINSIEK